MGQDGDTEFVLLLIHPGSLSLERTSCESHRKHKLHFGCGCGTDLWVLHEVLAQHLIGMLGGQ